MNTFIFQNNLVQIFEHLFFYWIIYDIDLNLLFFLFLSFMSALIGVNTVKCDLSYIYLHFTFTYFVIFILKTKTNFANKKTKL